MANTIVKWLVGPEIPLWVKLLILAGLLLAVLVWWKKAFWEE